MPDETIPAMTYYANFTELPGHLCHDLKVITIRGDTCKTISTPEENFIEKFTQYDKALKQWLKKPELPAIVPNEQDHYVLSSHAKAMVEFVNLPRSALNDFVAVEEPYPNQQRIKSLFPRVRMHPYFELFIPLAIQLSQIARHPNRPINTPETVSNHNESHREVIQNYVESYIENVRILLKKKTKDNVEPQFENWPKAIARYQRRYQDAQKRILTLRSKLRRQKKHENLIAIPLSLFISADKSYYNNGDETSIKTLISEDYLKKIKSLFNVFISETKRLDSPLSYFWLLTYAPPPVSLPQYKLMLIFPGDLEIEEVEYKLRAIKKRWINSKPGEAYSYNENLFFFKPFPWIKETSKEKNSNIEGILRHWLLVDQFFHIEDQSKRLRIMGCSYLTARKPRKSRKTPASSKPSINDTSPSAIADVSDSNDLPQPSEPTEVHDQNSLRPKIIKLHRKKKSFN